MNDIDYLKSNGIDVESGIEYLGDIQTYNETLQEFIELSDEKISKLKEYKEEGDLENYAVYAHSIKGDARYLGFIRLSEIALNHETQGKAGNKEFVDSDFDNFLQEIEKNKSIALNYLGDRSYDIIHIDDDASIDNISKEKAVLIVDDSSIIRDFLYKILSSEFLCIMADDGKKAINLLEKEDSDKIKAVFLDLNMPNFSGFDVLEYFKEKEWFNKFPVSIITGADDKGSIDKAFEYPIVDMLVKPFNENDVKRIADRTIKFNN